MLLKKLWRTMLLYKGQFISMIVMTALGVGIFVGFNMEWVSIEENMYSFFGDTGYADYRLYSEDGFSEEDFQKIAESEGVEKASRYNSVNMEIKGKGDSAAVAVTTNPEVSGFVLISGEKYNGKSPDGVWLSDKYAEANDVKTGDKITFLYKNSEIKGIVRGLIKSGEFMICVRDESQLMPDYTSHGFAYISPVMYEKYVTSKQYTQINVISDMTKKKFTETADKALGRNYIVISKGDTLSYSSAKGEAEEGKTMGSVLPALFLIIAMLTMVTTMHRLTVKEKIQIGTLKALGFKNRRITLHYTSYAMAVGVLGCAAGSVLGYGIAYYIMNPNGAMGTYLDLPSWNLRMPLFCTAAVFGIIFILSFIGFLSVKKMLRGTAAEVLRPYVPKRVKPLLIERTEWFKKRSFGTRWNMRDIMRHKSRSAMTLIGITGCMVLIVGSLGMSDTMDAFLDMYYGGASNYSSRIYLAEEADINDRIKILKKYGGDWSFSYAVQIEDKSVTLDIYSVTHCKVRFPDMDRNYTEINGKGAYICTRLAKQFGLSEGDTFRISPYGTDDIYTMRVEKVICSVSENIVISTRYANKMRLPYTIGSIYTDADKSEILPSDAIKNVQSKQMIADSFETFTSIMNTMVFVLILGAAVLGTVVLYNLGIMSYTERYREMATLKVVGFKDGKIGRLLISQNLWLSILGVITGLPAGIGVLAYLLNALAGEYEMKLSVSGGTVFMGIFLTCGISLAVSAAVARKNKNIDMVESLKSSE